VFCYQSRLLPLNYSIAILSFHFIASFIFSKLVPTLNPTTDKTKIFIKLKIMIKVLIVITLLFFKIKKSLVIMIKNSLKKPASHFTGRRSLATICLPRFIVNLNFFFFFGGENTTNFYLFHSFSKWLWFSFVIVGLFAYIGLLFFSINTPILYVSMDR
jgi:hypothetical protein